MSTPDELKEDPKYNYHCCIITKLCCGLIVRDINDAIQEGDGQRLMTLYKVALLIFKCYGCTKCAYATQLLLVKVNAILTEMKADQLVNNRFFSTHGNKDKNNPLDLKMEQINNLLKAMLKIYLSL